MPSSLHHLTLMAWFGLPELYHLAEGPQQREAGGQREQHTGGEAAFLDSMLSAAAAARMQWRLAEGREELLTAADSGSSEHSMEEEFSGEVGSAQSRGRCVGRDSIYGGHTRHERKRCGPSVGREGIRE